MPEGDAVRRTARRLDAALSGQELVRAELRVPRWATTDLRGATVVGTAVVGKHLLTRLHDDSRAVTLHSHLRMDGRWVTGAARSRPGAGPWHEIRVWLATAQRQAVGLRVHDIEVLPTQDEARLVGHLGPDILAETFDAREAAARVRAQGARPLVEALLDQTVLSGLGTVWAAETAFAARTSPYTPAAATELSAALDTIRQRMAAAVAGDPRAERRDVYRRHNLPCRVCGTVIRAGPIVAAPRERTTYWCPSCQPVP